jgi:hypothetical protein
VVKRLERESDHSSPSSAQVKNELNYTSTSPAPLNALMDWTWRTLKDAERYSRLKADLNFWP